jgi:hypothetical protein
LLDKLECIKQDAKRGPLHGAQIKMLKLLARHEFPGAKELLKKCQQSSGGLSVKPVPPKSPKAGDNASYSTFRVSVIL